MPPAWMQPSSSAQFDLLASEAQRAAGAAGRKRKSRNPLATGDWVDPDSSLVITSSSSSGRGRGGGRGGAAGAAATGRGTKRRKPPARKCEYITERSNRCTRNALPEGVRCNAHLTTPPPKRCAQEGCDKVVRGAQNTCRTHGGGHGRCSSEGCSKSARGSTSKCVAHGGGRRCNFTECSKSAVDATGKCKAHGDGKAKKSAKTEMTKAEKEARAVEKEARAVAKKAEKESAKKAAKSAVKARVVSSTGEVSASLVTIASDAQNGKAGGNEHLAVHFDTGCTGGNTGSEFVVANEQQQVCNVGGRRDGFWIAMDYLVRGSAEARDWRDWRHWSTAAKIRCVLFAFQVSYPCC
jgi:hypothetical protein